MKVHRERSCRACRGASSLHRHHLVSRGQGGDDVDANLVPVCRRCHWALHHAGGEKRDAALLLIGRSLTAEEIGYVVEHKGPAWLEDTYGWKEVGDGSVREVRHEDRP